MIETQVQKMVIDAVRSAGGAGTKLSHRHLIGVCDLLIKLPESQPLLLEAKLAKFAVGVALDRTFKLDVTVLQHKFLTSYLVAGMRVGVLSALMKGKNLYLTCYDLHTMVFTKFTATVADHVIDGRSSFDINHMLREFADDRTKGSAGRAR
jgi:hypothetical protein